MRTSLVFAACFVAALSAVHADTGAAPHAAPQAVHHQQSAGPQLQPQPHHQQPAFGQQQQQQAGPLPYPLRRQSNNGLERARAAVMSMVESIMDAGARFRKMASARLSTMFRRRSAPQAPLKRSQQPLRPAPQFRPQPQPQLQPQLQPQPQPQQQLQ